MKQKTVGASMANMKKSDVIGVPCTMMPGPFSGERMITCDTVDGPISGFVRDSELAEIRGQWYVRAIVESMRDDLLSVRIRGSFFTTNGMARIPRSAALAA